MRTFKSLAIALLLLRASGEVSAVPPEEPSLHIGPYLQNVAQHSIVIMWETTDPAVGSVEYGRSADDLNHNVIEPQAGKIHEITLSGLESGTAYFYRCRWKSEVTRVWRFKTAPPPGAEKVKIVAYGDSRDNPEVHGTISKLIARLAPGLVLHTGDIVSDGAKLPLWKPQFFDPIRPFAAEIPLLPVLGNHERNSDYFYSYYALNNNEAWWSVDYGPVHIIGLDSNQPGEPGTEQYEWLAQDLEANQDARWKVVSFHHPIFNSHPDRPVHEARWSWHPLFQKYGVDLVINGHDHYYARTLPIGKAAKGQRGVIYVTTGGGGAPFYPSQSKIYTAFRRSVFHLLELEFDGDELLGRARDDEGRVFDAFALHKDAIVSPEEFVSYEMIEAERLLEEGMAGISLDRVGKDELRLTGHVALPLNFGVPVKAQLRWMAPEAWRMLSPAVTQALAPGDSLSIRVEAVAPERDKYPLPSLEIEIEGDNTRWTPPNPPLGFRNTRLSVNIEDALFAAALRGVGEASAAGLRFIRDFPGSRYTPQVLQGFWQMVPDDPGARKEFASDLRIAMTRVSTEQERALFYPPLFLLDDLSGWDKWLRRTHGGDVSMGRAMAPNLLGLIQRGGVRGGLVRDWHIAGPFDNTDDEGFYLAYEPEQRLDLAATYATSRGKTIRWQKARPNRGDYLDFTRIFKENEQGIVFALAEIRSEKKALVPLLLGSNDAAVVWVNGEEVYREHQHRRATPGEDLIMASLKKGRNQVLIKIDQVGGGWGLYLHVVDREGVLSF